MRRVNEPKSAYSDSGQGGLFVKFSKKLNWFRLGIAGLGDRYRRVSGWRYRVLIGITAVCYLAIGWRLVSLGGMAQPTTPGVLTTQEKVAAVRPNIIDRNGFILATDVKVHSVYGEPCRIIDADDAAEKILTILPDLTIDYLRDRLNRQNCFVWIKREISPKEKRKLHDLGIPGLGFLSENRRFYPSGATASHILGLTDIDNRGIAGLERYIDNRGFKALLTSGLASGFGNEIANLRPVSLSIDIRVQSLMHQKLSAALGHYRALAASAVMLDVKTGEVIALVSLPDYNPNNRKDVLSGDRLNRISAGVYELGSVFKMATVAMAIDSGRVATTDRFDTRKALTAGSYKINDFHGKHRILTVPEVFIYSSNIGAAKMAKATGKANQKYYLSQFGLLDELHTELPETARPLAPHRWNDAAIYTIAFGHSLAVTPLQFAAAAAAMVNGGNYITPTFIKRSQQENPLATKRILKPTTSKFIRYLMRLNVLKGSGRRAAVPGYLVGGKTGTAEKIIKGRYSNSKRLNSFLSVFPNDDPQYLLLVVIDDPKPVDGQKSATAARNAALVNAQIIKSAAPMLGIIPDITKENPVALKKILKSVTN